MNFHFGVVTIFLILNVTFAQSTGDGSSKKKRISSKDQFSSDVATDSSIQSFINRRSIQNSFLQPSNSNRNRRSFLSNSFTSQTSDIVFRDDDFIPVLNNNNNTFLNPFKINTTYAPVLNTPAPDNDFISPVPTSSKIHPSVPSSLTYLLSTKASRVKGISEFKCEEYVAQIAGWTLITALTGTSSSSSDVRKVVNTCGGDANRLVVGGDETDFGEFPHMVALGTGSFDQFTLLCGGTLISHSWVLTAAHCTHGTSFVLTDARLGFHSLTDREGVTVPVKSQIEIHPDYKPPAMYADIALVQLMSPVTFTPYIRPACLYQVYDTIPRQAWITGWGQTDFSSEVGDKLLKARLELIDNILCTIRHNSSISVPYGITSNMICAGSPPGSWTKDTCLGYSDGPLQIVHPDNQCLFQVIGITSFGQGCAMLNVPGVYTRVSHYLSWIENIVWPQGQEC